MRKYIKCLCVLILALFLIALSGCGGLSDSELSSAVEKYETALQQLCDDYGLDDAEIKVEKNISGEKIGKEFCYFGSSSVTSTKFSELSGSEAFSFMKEFERLEIGMFDYENVSISYIAHVDCGYDTYTYDSARSDGNTLEYLMLYNNAAVTYKNGELVYDIF